MGGTVESAISSLGIPAANDNSQFSACWTSSSGMTFQACFAVALALWAPSICNMPPQAMTHLASGASTKERCRLMLR